MKVVGLPLSTERNHSIKICEATQLRLVPQKRVEGFTEEASVALMISLLTKWNET